MEKYKKYFKENKLEEKVISEIKIRIETTALFDRYNVTLIGANNNEIVGTDISKNDFPSFIKKITGFLEREITNY